MNELKDFFGASVGAAAALIGLLFVAITLAPEQVFGLDLSCSRLLRIRHTTGSTLPPVAMRSVHWV